MRSLLFLLTMAFGCGRDFPVAAPVRPPLQRVRLTAVTSDTRQGFRFRDRAVVTFDPPPGLAAHDGDGGQVEGSAAHVDFEFAASRMMGLRAGHDALCLTEPRVSSLSAVDGGSCAWSSWAQFGLAGDDAAGAGLLLRTNDSGEFRLLVVESGADPATNTNFVVLDYAAEGSLPAANEIFACSAEAQPCVEHGDCCNSRHSCVMGACQY